jgi:hypothetical protein
MAGQPFEVISSTKSKKISKKGIIISVIVFIFLTASVVLGVILVKQQQNIQEKAAQSLCPGAEACPVAGQPDLLMSCTPANADGTANKVSCSNLGYVGKIVSCGSQTFCCPSLGAAWTTDLSACSSSTSPSPTSSPVAFFAGTQVSLTSSSPSPTASSSSSLFDITPTPMIEATLSALASTASATPYVQTTPLPIPVTGTDWPTIVGAALGIGIIVASVLIAL